MWNELNKVDCFWVKVVKIVGVLLRSVVQIVGLGCRCRGLGCCAEAVGADATHDFDVEFVVMEDEKVFVLGV
jgi:hypothetical protein